MACNYCKHTLNQLRYHLVFRFLGFVIYLIQTTVSPWSVMPPSNSSVCPCDILSCCFLLNNHFSLDFLDSQQQLESPIARQNLQNTFFHSYGLKKKKKEIWTRALLPLMFWVVLLFFVWMCKKGYTCSKSANEYVYTQMPGSLPLK